MEYLQNTELVIPLGHMVIFIALSALCLLFSRFKVSLALTFSFTFYWAFIHNKEAIFANIHGSGPFMLIYFVSGCILVFFALCTLVLQE